MSPRDVEISPSVQFVRVEGDYVLMDLAAGLYFGLDPVASHIWQSLSEHGDPAQAAQELSRDYDVDPAQARADIEKWIAELETKGLVRHRSAASAAPDPAAVS
ncbi:MAG TPA: PqqD family protein [Thermoanaerobaculia bacterium]